MPRTTPPVAARFLIPGQVYWKNKADTVMVVRLGALANAFLSSCSLPSGTLATGVGQTRDAVQAAFLTASYLKEIIDAIDAKRPWELIGVGLQHGCTLAKPVEHYRRLFSRGKNSLYHRFIKSTRDTKGFHVDREHFEEWMAQFGAPSFVLWRKDGPSPIDMAFTASLQIQQLFGTRLTQTDIDELKDALEIGALVETMGVGLVAEHGIDPAACWARMRLRDIHIEYTFNDGRPPLKETIQLVVDESGDLLTVASELRDHTTTVFRGNRRSGAVWQGPTVPLALSSDRGTALARPGALVNVPPTKDRRFEALAARNMAEWGELRTKQFHDILIKVREKALTDDELQRAFADLDSDRTYWAEKLKQL